MHCTPDPPAFEAAVRQHLEPARGQFNYDQMLHTFLSVERFRQWAAVVDRYRPVRGSRFLSSGCGYAGSLVAYHDAGAATVTGVEVDAESVRIGRLRVERITGAELWRYDGVHLPFPDGAFDIVESMDVIEHTADPDTYLRELKRVLAPSGVILLVTPNRLWPVEQHLDVVGPPWLPVGLANRLFPLLGRLPTVGPDRRFRYERLPEVRTQNLSLRRLQRLAKANGLFLRTLVAAEHAPVWPLPRRSPLLEGLAVHRFGAHVAVVPTLAVTLEHDDRSRALHAGAGRA